VFAAAPSGPPAWKTLPCWYLLGTEDKAIPPALQRFMAERANATVVEVPASHVSAVIADHGCASVGAWVRPFRASTREHGSVSPLASATR
jgi:pimeloyl-ACP methyl ester carboxylesterase